MSTTFRLVSQMRGSCGRRLVVETYRDAGADYYTRRNPDRAARSLIRRLEALGHHVTIEPREAAA